jgi:hypothetical protein
MGIEYLQAAHEQQKEAQRIDPMTDTNEQAMAIDRLAGRFEWRTDRPFGSLAQQLSLP